MATTMESDAGVTFEDQNRINQFARTNALLVEAKEDLAQKKKDIVNLEDAESDIMMCEEADEEGILYNLGEIFIKTTSSQAQSCIQDLKEKLEKEIKTIEAKAETYKETLSVLKVALYAKFGNNINLEAEDN